MNSRRLWRALACGALMLAAAPAVRAEGTFDIPAGARFNQDKLAKITEFFKNEVATGKIAGANVLIQQHGLASVAFPAISTGIYRFPAERAAGIAVSAVAGMLPSAPSVTRVVFCCFSPDSGRLHEEAVAALGRPCAD